MGGRGIVRAVLLAATLVAGLGAGAAQAQEDHSYYGPRLIEERVRIAAASGRTIAATILRAEGQGPFGAVILNHGVSASARERSRESSDLLINAAAVFARRGYVVVMPLRRGFGATGGDMAEDPGSCSNPDYKGAEQNAADDVMAAYNYTRALPYVDGNRMILAGQSAGGMVAVFTAGSRNPPGLVAVLAFAAGRGADPERQPLLALDRVPNIKSDACKGLYRAFLESPGPRAYAVSEDGRCGFAGGLQDAKDIAIKQCGNVAKGGCRLYAVDDAVIWK